METIAVSGSNGFIGGALLGALEQRGLVVKPVERGMLETGARTRLAHHLTGCGVVIHCAGLTPHGRHLSDDDFDTANHQFTRNIGLASADAGVGRFVFLSSIAVVARNTSPLNPRMDYNPAGAYGRSKAAGECALSRIGNLRTVIARPPLVYGAASKGDLSALVRLCVSRLPLPFGAMNNRRSMVGVTNLVDALTFLATATTIPTGGPVFHVSDGIDLSLRELVTTIRQGLGRAPNLLSVPPGLLAAALRTIGRGAMADKLLGELTVDASDMFATGWRPPVAPAHDLFRMAAHFAREREKA